MMTGLDGVRGSGRDDRFRWSEGLAGLEGVRGGDLLTGLDGVRGWQV